MELRFEVKTQRITRMDTNELAGDSVNFVKAVFSFSEEWDGCTKTALFKKGNNAYQAILVNDICIIPHEVLSAGKVVVSVFGIKDDMRITATTTSFPVLESGYEEGMAPEDPSPSIYEQIIALIENGGGGGGGNPSGIEFSIDEDGNLIATYDDEEEEE